MDRVYLNNLSSYNRIVNQRNALLKESYFQKNVLDTLDIWDMQLVQYGNKIMDSRKKFIKEINQIISKIHYQLTGGKEEIEVLYEPNTGEVSLEEALIKCRKRDIRMKSTTKGPHRDDLCFMIKDMDIRKFGSQGQQRTAALSLKLAEIEFVKRIIKDTPVLLLDDVLSELDKNRQNYLLDNIHDIQTIVTCTGVDEFVNHRFDIDQIFHVDNGTVAKEN